ncbi:uncharacterized protein [Palaemon carinicauda]|uniref:uncharacterized protein n=1 Tax=Palaemon carinicauda TaxID=392227 RepID=UPI0035B660A7
MEKVRVSVENLNGSIISTLTLEDAQPANSGTYTCNPSNATPASVLVHVLRGEHPAAMQTNGAFICLMCDSPIWRRYDTIINPSILWQLGMRKVALFAMETVFLIHSILEDNRPRLDVFSSLLTAGGRFVIFCGLFR